MKQHKRKHKNTKSSFLKPTVDDNLDPEKFPEQIEQLAIDVTTFLNCLNEFPEFTDEAVNSSIRSFEGDLKVSNGLHASMPILTSLPYLVLGLVFEGV
jgi:hypothetical protein